MPGENWMLLIGIDEYPGPRYKALDNAVKDIERLRNILEDRYSFASVDKPIYNQDATRENIIEALYSLTVSTGKDDNVIIIFGGHGDRHTFTNNGFWVPVDWAKVSDSVSNSTIYDAIEGIPAKHILLISDSCYSGTFITRTRNAEKKLSHDQLEALASRWVFTSGSEERVSDGKIGMGSPFNMSLCEFLQNNQLPSVSVGEMFEAVIRMTKASSTQTPMADQIRRSGNQGGQMILRLRSTRSVSLISIVKPSFPIPSFPFDYYLSRTVTYYEFQKAEISYFFDSERGKSFLQDALLTHRKIVLLGSAGSGKSVELQHLALTLADSSTPYIPIYKRFNTYTGQDIEIYLPDGWEKVNIASVVILLDGLDEIQTQFFFVAIRKIIEFCNKRPDMRVVISCRTNFYELPTTSFSGTLEGFSVYMLNDISLAEIREFSINKFQLDGQEFIKDVYEASLIDLIQKPYFLNLLIDHYVKNGCIPTNRAIIFEEALLNYYINDKEHFKTSGQVLSKPETFTLLEKIAFIMEVMGKNFITDEELHKVFPLTYDYEKCKYLPAFKKQDNTNQWMFEHNNIQEFLAARVLSQKTFEKLIEIISLPSAGETKIKPTWANTLSFFISISKKEDADKVLEWVARNDVEIVIRFEPDRIDEQKRISVFKRIFEDYSTKQIWLSSNKFSDADLAKFGWFDEIIQFLLEKIQSPKYSRITKLNAIRILDNYNLKDFPTYVKLVKQSLLALFQSNDLKDYDIYSVLGALARLNITDKNTIDFAVSKFRNRKNQYIRAGLYKLLHHSPFLEDHLDILFEGLDLTKIENPLEDRESVNLMDESFHLKIALQKIKSPTGLKKLLTHFTDKKTRHLYLSDHKEIITALIENSIKAYNEDPSIYQFIRDYFVVTENLYNKNTTQLIIPFFEQTGTKWNIFLFIWKSKEISDYEKSQLIEILITDEIIHQFVEAYKKNEFSQEDAQTLHQYIFWKDKNNSNFENYLQQLEFASQEFFDLKLNRPILKDWNLINKKKTQIAFDLLFDRTSLLAEIENIFADLGKQEISHTDLFDYRSKYNDDFEISYVASAIELIRNFTYRGGLAVLEDIRHFIINTNEFYSYQIETIYDYLHGSYNSYIEVSESQLAFISEWCIQDGKNHKILWFFIHRFCIRLEDSRLLDLTLYYDFNSESKFSESGTIEQLEIFLSRQVLKAKVTTNLESRIEDSFSWLSNAGYAIRHNIKQAYPLILSRLERVVENEYKFNEILEFWFTKTKETKRLARFIENVYSDILRWKAISLLSSSNKEQGFLKEYLKRIIVNKAEARDSHFAAANYLMLMNDLDGFNFCAKDILKNPNPQFDFRHELNNMSRLKDPDAIPQLMQLLYLGKQKEFQLDRFNSLESVVIDTLYNIGIESDANFILVREAILKFLLVNEGELENLNFLHFTVQKMEDQLNMKKSQDYSIEQALSEWVKSL